MPKGFLQGCNSLRMGVAAGSSLGKTRQVLDGLTCLVRPCIMMRQAIIRLLQAVGIEHFQGLPGRRMQRSSVASNEALVGYLLCQGVLEDVHGFFSATPLVEKLQPLEFLKPRL